MRKNSEIQVLTVRHSEQSMSDVAIKFWWDFWWLWCMPDLGAFSPLFLCSLCIYLQTSNYMWNMWGHCVQQWAEHVRSCHQILMGFLMAVMDETSAQPQWHPTSKLCIHPFPANFGVAKSAKHRLNIYGIFFPSPERYLGAVWRTMARTSSACLN